MNITNIETNKQMAKA